MTDNPKQVHAAARTKHRVLIDGKYGAIAEHIDESTCWLIGMALRAKAAKDDACASLMTENDQAALADTFSSQAKQCMALAEAFESCESAMLIVDDASEEIYTS